MKRATMRIVCLLAAALGAVGSVHARQLENGFWCNGNWVNGFWCNGAWMAASATAGYLAGSSSFAGGVVDGVPLAGLSKDGRRVRGALRGSEIVGWVDEPACPTVGTADAPCRPGKDKGWEQLRHGDWFVGATIDVSALPYLDTPTAVCNTMEPAHDIRPDPKRSALALSVRIEGFQWNEGKGVASYVLTVDGGLGHEGTPFCGGDENGIPVPAIPLQGAWNLFPDPVRGGAWRDEGPDGFTFACTNAALGKCADNGYRPWDPPRAMSGPAGTAEVADGRALHQACTRMVRADYCGDGRSFTVSGTRIDVADRYGISSPTAGLVVRWTGLEPILPDTIEVMDGEGFWDAEGAIGISCHRWSALASAGACRALERVTQVCPPAVDANMCFQTPDGRTLPALLVNAHAPACGIEPVKPGPAQPPLPGYFSDGPIDSISRIGQPPPASLVPVERP